MSSWFVQVTELPLATVIVSGPNLKLSIMTCAASSERAPDAKSRPTRTMARLVKLRMIGTSAGQRRVDDSQRRFRLHQADTRGAQEVPQFARWNGHRPGSLRYPGHALRERG